MAKRFTDSNKWDDAWFLELKPELKLFWFYLLDKCDHAGIWKVNFRLASFLTGVTLSQGDVLSVLNNRVRVIRDDIWFLPKFIEFQYGALNQKNRAHASVIKILSSYNLINKQGALKGLYDNPKGVKDKDKDKDKVKDKDKDKENSNQPLRAKLSPSHIGELFNEICTGGKVGHASFFLGPEDVKKFQILSGHPALQVEKGWVLYFNRIAASDYLTGKVNNFVIDFPWAIDPDNASKIMAGRYDNRTAEASEVSSLDHLRPEDEQ